jgi:hypothetical protein
MLIDKKSTTNGYVIRAMVYRTNALLSEQEITWSETIKPRFNIEQRRDRQQSSV